MQIKWAKRLLRRLPGDPASLLDRAKTYADPVFFRIFLDHLDALLFDDPQSALRWAKIAPHLALLTPEAEGPEGREDHRNRLTQAWAICGGAQFACGNHAAAEEAFDEALELIDSEVITSVIKSEVYRRRAYLRVCQGRPEEALSLAESSLDHAGDQPLAVALALVCEGYAAATLRRYSDALRAFGEALTLIDPKDSPAAARVHLAAIGNLAYVVSSSPRHADHTAALDYIRQARELVKGGRRFVPRYRLLWVEGLVWARLGYHARAETAFKIAREGFEALEMPFEIALVSLDLGAVYAEHSEWDKLTPLAVETFQRFRVLAADTGTIAALSLWTDAVKARKLTDEITTRARQKIEARIGAGGCCKSRERSTV